MEARVIQARTARSTGALVEVTYEPAEDKDCRWQTSCFTHGGECVGHITRALALSFASRPEEWCTGCAKIFERRARNLKGPAGWSDLVKSIRFQGGVRGA